MLPRRGDSGGGVSHPISDTGDPFLTYGVASRMYLTRQEGNEHRHQSKTIFHTVSMGAMCQFLHTDY